MVSERRDALTKKRFRSFRFSSTLPSHCVDIFWAGAGRDIVVEAGVRVTRLVRRWIVLRDIGCHGIETVAWNYVAWERARMKAEPDGAVVRGS